MEATVSPVVRSATLRSGAESSGADLTVQGEPEPIPAPEEETEEPPGMREQEDKPVSSWW
ncbi:MAG: hypothetical protein F6J89_19995 [Symploca sp. SIO1C4]|uniref:Uncharacterized protein n=1 Tax=Symploca sp. SIO1C4 TaxID=2607765 RepID=A0A6B3NIH0_9CYAN|nr:hypothetical protein [Symploca sp. SIO1C4]